MIEGQHDGMLYSANPPRGKAYGHTEKETTFEKNQERKGAGGIIRQMRE